MSDYEWVKIDEGHLRLCKKEECRCRVNSGCPAVVGIGKGWPMVSESAGVAPEQVPAMQRQLAEQGVKCQFDSEGRPTFNSPSHRKQCLKAMGLVDKNSYY